MDAIKHLVRGRTTDLSDLQVRRILPSAVVRMVGPFAFVDHFGPVRFAAGTGIDVRPHPHIGLATVTYLFDGEFVHRDSLGSEQRIVPGDVNWMIAGRGIVHSERTPAQIRARPHSAHGVQTWVALPDEHEDAAPSFEHHPSRTLPRVALGGAHVTVIAGTAFGARSPVSVLSPTLYAAATLAAGATLAVPDEHEQRAVYVIDGAATVEGQPIEPGVLATLASGIVVHLHAAAGATLMLLGGASVGSRLIDWNFVASSRGHIDEACSEWARYGDVDARGRFGSVPGETEFIPLPAR